MKVIIAERCGFCPGVTNAIKIAESTLEKNHTVFSLGEIIHNKDVVSRLAGKGLKTVKDIDEISDNSGTVLIRSHGATNEQIKKIRQKGLEIVDATCILVKRLQKIAKSMYDDGYTVVIIGDKGHPEVQAVVGQADGIIVVGNEGDILNLPRDKKLGIVCQTTQSPEHFARMLAEIVKNGFTELKVVDTLCNEAKKRQTCAVELCRQVDVMFVLGGLHSANTRKLAELCKKHNPNTFHLQNADELDIRIVFGKSLAGVTAGASTPKWVIDEFVERLLKL